MFLRGSTCLWLILMEFSSTMGICCDEIGYKKRPKIEKLILLPLHSVNVVKKGVVLLNLRGAIQKRIPMNKLNHSNQPLVTLTHRQATEVRPIYRFQVHRAAEFGPHEVVALYYRLRRWVDAGSATHGPSNGSLNPSWIQIVRAPKTPRCSHLCVGHKTFGVRVWP